ncbi:NUDIX domain-containing protein [Deinococcus peraridilitoris]|uniref:NTP pyrophosphohydrolase n=1 Tax=Deinococcus peraridilitoris (strain DSM 19664 / LMG 22246 / CIP 109416 / KR-200) TaxID=937777 RepID=L0A0U9_DEIPD|nr:NUDIX domain-containing protein [Deinococcus peraridilitoris]AFZ66610.1 NTP pyrophosphohydrolase [Deinococcus peraridilitoris DSM 19664]
MTELHDAPTPVSHLRDLRCLVGSRPLFSVGACVCLLDQAGRLLLQRRTDNGRWGLIGGSSELGETAVETAVRETHEEVGLLLSQEAFELLHVLSGPALYHRYPNGDEVYNVGSVFLAHLPTPETVLHPDHESVELRFFALHDLPEDLSGPVELEALRVLRAHFGLPPSPAPQVARAVPPVGRGYLLELRQLVGTRPLFSVGAAVVARDELGRVLLHRRSDTGRWGLPGVRANWVRRSSRPRGVNCSKKRVPTRMKCSS